MKVFAGWCGGSGWDALPIGEVDLTSPLVRAAVLAPPVGVKASMHGLQCHTH